MSFRAPLGGALKAEEYAVRRWTLTVDANTVKADVLEQRFWQNIVGKLRVGDLVSVWAEDGSLDMEMRILSTKDGIAKFRIRSAYSDDAAAEEKIAQREDAAERRAQADGVLFKMKWLGPNGKWAVINTATMAPVERGLTKPDAEKRCAALIEQAASPVAA